jgi:hypothetical protein
MRKLPDCGMVFQPAEITAMMAVPHIMAMLRFGHATRHVDWK